MLGFSLVHRRAPSAKLGEGSGSLSDAEKQTFAVTGSDKPLGPEGDQEVTAH
jgi:hypothetical protein